MVTRKNGCDSPLSLMNESQKVAVICFVSFWNLKTLKFVLNFKSDTDTVTGQGLTISHWGQQEITVSLPFFLAVHLNNFPELA